MASYHKSGPPTQALVQKEHTFHLYVHQHLQYRPNANQQLIAQPGGPNGMGDLHATDWTIRDGPRFGAKIVGRFQGLVVAAGLAKKDWLLCDNILFTDEWHKGSTLQVIGKYENPEGPDAQWAIVGGTGEFACAQGVASYKVIERNDNGSVMELNIHVICLTFQKPDPVIPGDKTELVGGNGGDEFDISEKPKRIESVTIRSGDVIDSIAFSYIDQAGNKQTAGPWGGSGGTPSTISFAPTETVNKNFGTTGDFGTHTVVTSLTIATSTKTYGPFGKGKGTPFTIPKENDKSVLGLFARAGLVVDAIGAYVSPSATN